MGSKVWERNCFKIDLKDIIWLLETQNVFGELTCTPEII